MNKRLKALLAGLDAQGAEIIPTGKNGFKVLCPEGGIVLIHSTNSDHRAELNLKSELKKRGMLWPLGK